MNPLPSGSELPEVLLQKARAGDGQALGRLLELYCNYLRLLARTQIDAGLRVRLAPSDLVQETLLEAHRDFGRFLGTTEKELLAWMRQILVRNLADLVRRHRAGPRDWQRQESLEAMLDRSSQEVEEALARGISSPSAIASRREQAVLLADALARLPPHYRDVIVLRNLERRRFDDIAARMGRSAGAVRMLWARALEQLSHLLEEPP
jgi:RNA polymerase sigma-70 factor (ECF subfamily)